MNLKTVNEASLQQQLDAARHGTPEEQKEFLQSIDDLLENDQSVVINTMMDDNDLEWLKPLALELFLPAVEIVFDGMRRKLRPYEEEFADDETHAPFTIMRWDIIDDATVFTPDSELIAEIKKTILAQLKTLDNISLYRLRVPLYGISEVIEDELYSRNDPLVLEHRGDLYRWGDEEHGFFIDYDKAKAHYDRAGIEFDPVETARQDRKNATESFPEFATYRLEGADALTVKQMLHTLYEKFGKHSEVFMNLPLEVVMKALVGSDAYVGYIQSVEDVEDRPDTIDIEVEFYGCSTDCLKYALLQALPSVKVEFTEHD